MNRGRLVLCATPIGNLGDMTPRVVEALKSADLIAAEDTRNSIKLLNHFDIHTPMTSYHEFNKVEKARELVDKMLAGCELALITDAGTPAISDPGEVLVAMCHENGIPVTSLPGACACITALTMSGLPARRFIFEGFLPADKDSRAKKEKKEIIESLKQEYRTVILYEAPHRLIKTLETLRDELGADRPLTLCRELTKKFENVFPTTIGGALDFYKDKEPKGEYVLVLGGANRQEEEAKKQASWEEIDLEEHMEIYLNQGMSEKDAMKQVASDRGVSKRDIYKKIVNLKKI